MHGIQRISISIILFLVAVSLGACGGMKFVRNDGAHRYRALPMGTSVRLVGASLELPQPVVAIGVLKLTVSGGEKPDPGPVGEKFRNHAARYGCDAVVGMKVNSRTTTLKKRTKKIGEGGKVTSTEKEVPQHHHDWEATCTRTAKAPGGLLEGTGKTAEMPANALPVVPVPPRVEPVKTRAGKVNPLAEKVWRQLAVFRSQFLSSWGQQLRGPAPAEIEVLECLNELLVQVTGPTGFWRKTVPLDWFGCNANADVPQCKHAKAAAKALAPYDRMQQAIGRVSEKGAPAFLKRNAKRIDTLLEDVVPLQASLSGMKTTTFYKKHFK
jgi:hypothetical protein